MKRFVLPLVLLLILLAAIVVLIDPAGWFAREAEEDEEAASLPVLCRLEKDAISAFEFAKPDGVTVRLERAGERWNLVGTGVTYVANQDKVDKLLEDVPGLSAVSLATDKPDKHATFEVDDEHATKLQIFGKGGEAETTLVVGKSAPNYSGAFVRLSGANEVYRTNRNVRALLAYAFEDYRTKTPWKFDQLAAESVRIRPLDGAEYKEYTRTDGVWKTPAGENANQNALTELVEKLTALTINSFAGELANPEEAAASGMVDLEPQLIVTSSAGTYSLTIGAADEALRFVMDQDGHLYRIGEGSLRFYTELDLASLDIAAEPETAAEAAPSVEVVPPIEQK